MKKMAKTFVRNFVDLQKSKTELEKFGAKCCSNNVMLAYCEIIAMFGHNIRRLAFLFQKESYSLQSEPLAVSSEA